MCGIVGYIGKNEALPVLLDGLKRLEYRGYDSAGLCIVNHEAVRLRAPGRIENLENLTRATPPTGSLGIAHTRWATHGVPNEANAHPHSDCTEKIFVVHNGIIENYRELKISLEKSGHRFTSETDTEVLAHLIESLVPDAGLVEAVRLALLRVKGTYGLVVLSTDEPDKLVAARNSSPLIIGIGEGEFVVASDTAAAMSYVGEEITLEDDDMAIIDARLPKPIIQKLDRTLRHPLPQAIQMNRQQVERGGFAHFMAKEIHETPFAVQNAIRGRTVSEDGMVKLGGLEPVAEKLRQARRIIITACGTAYYAGLTGGMMIEEYAGIPTEVYLASEFRYRSLPFDEQTVVLGVSQSGETADTKAAIKEAKNRGLLTLGIVNAVGSEIARKTDAGVYNHAGPEIGVASTKAFVSQLTVFALMAVYLGRMRNMPIKTGCQILRELDNLPGLLQRILRMDESIRVLAAQYAHYDNFLYIGRKYNYPSALEGALKLKEVSYAHAEGYAAGEMKHGPIALITKDFPTVAIALSDPVYGKMISNIQEIKARGGPVIAIATEGNEDIKHIADDVIYVPQTMEMLSPILVTVPLQLFAYHIASLRGCDVDKPRNLAKSVTVE
ncbi:MAG: glutamine--fructose-6-phosphate transaminase (isomerizing) [bacterium]|nr:glutamine--fructose-6-phosphate transaminase (isomerizing) [bacterium]